MTLVVIDGATATKVILEQALCLERPVKCNSRSQEVDLVLALLGGRGVEVHTLEQTLDIEVLWLCRLHVRLVINSEVVVNILAVLAIHTT